jgi:YNFM family putative membrane transporter
MRISSSRQWHYRHTVLALCVLAYFSIRFIEFALALVFPDIAAALSTSVFTIGVAVTASTITYAIPQLPSGALGDRFGERTVIIAALGLTALGSLVLSAAPVGGAVVLGMALIGLVSGAYYNPATGLLTDLFDETGRAIGIHRIGAQIVGFTGPIIAFVGVTYGWRVVPLLSVLVVVPVLVGFGLFVRSRSPTQPEPPIRERIQPSALTDLLSRPGIAFTTAIASFGQFVDTATFSFLPYIFREYHGLSLPVAGGLMTLYFVVLTVAQPIVGWLSDHLGRDSVATVSLLIGVTGYLVLLARGAFAVVVAAVVLLGFGMGWSPPVQSRVIDQLAETERAIGFGLVRTVYIACASLCGVVIGGAVTIAGWTSAIVILALVMAIPAVALGANAVFRIGL